MFDDNERNDESDAGADPDGRTGPSTRDADDRRYSRRAMLATLSAAGAGGAVSGAAARHALSNTDDAFSLGSADADSGSMEGFHDVATFGRLEANVLRAGRLNLGTCWEEPSEDCTPDDGGSSLEIGPLEAGDSGSATLRCGLAGNPAWTWLRTSCPADTCGLHRETYVTMWYDGNCDGQLDDGEPLVAVGDTPVDDLRLCDALDLLHGGVLLDADPSTTGADPLAPGEECCIGISWRVEPHCVDDDEAAITVDLLARQRRHHPTPSNPWPDASCDVTCDYDCAPCDFPGLSFVAFCIEPPGKIEEGDVRFTPTYDVEGEPFRVDWEADVQLAWVVLFYGTDDGKFFENFAVADGQTSGTAEVGDGDQKLEWYQDGTSPADENGQTPTSPCPDGADCGVRFNFDDMTWDGVCDG